MWTIPPVKGKSILKIQGRCKMCKIHFTSTQYNQRFCLNCVGKYKMNKEEQNGSDLK
jgi:rRNA maturation endonuclease Nob1